MGVEGKKEEKEMERGRNKRKIGLRWTKYGEHHRHQGRIFSRLLKLLDHFINIRRLQKQEQPLSI